LITAAKAVRGSHAIWTASCDCKEKTMPELSHIDPRSAALLVMDYQVDTLTKFMTAAQSADAIARVPGLIAMARDAAMTEEDGRSKYTFFAPADRRRARHECSNAAEANPNAWVPVRERPGRRLAAAPAHLHGAVQFELRVTTTAQPTFLVQQC
jgi:hypothetical protein